MSERVTVDVPKDSFTEDLQFNATIDASYLACLMPHLAGIADSRYVASGEISSDRWLEDLDALKLGVVVEWEYPFLIRVLFGVYPMLNQMVYQLSPETEGTKVTATFAITPVDWLGRMLTWYVRRQVRQWTSPPPRMFEQLNTIRAVAESPELFSQFEAFRQAMLESREDISILRKPLQAVRRQLELPISDN